MTGPPITCANLSRLSNLERVMRTIDLNGGTASLGEISIESIYHADLRYVEKIEEAKCGETSSLGLMVLDQITRP